MSARKVGAFDAARAGIFRPFCPVSAFHHLTEIPLESLWESGKRLILLDVDNTLVEWKGEDFTEEVLNWLEKARAMGFEMCILSNTRHPERLGRISERLKIDTLRDKFKPSTRMYKLALEKYAKKPEEAVMVGDQILTDIWGANRSGIEGLWVHRIHHREFVGTKVNRQIERFILAFLYRTMPAVEAITHPEEEYAGSGLLASPLVRQILKFGIVGGTSFIIDFGIFWWLSFYASSGNQLLSERFGTWLVAELPSIFGSVQKNASATVPFFKTISASVAILNSFYLNRAWTFQIKDAAEKGRQFRRFVAISLIGLALNTVSTTVFAALLGGHNKRSLAFATIFATILVAVWNFTGQKFWAFRQEES